MPSSGIRIQAAPGLRGGRCGAPPPCFHTLGPHRPVMLPLCPFTRQLLEAPGGCFAFGGAERRRGAQFLCRAAQEHPPLLPVRPLLGWEPGFGALCFWGIFIPAGGFYAKAQTRPTLPSYLGGGWGEGICLDLAQTSDLGRAALTPPHTWCQKLAWPGVKWPRVPSASPLARGHHASQRLSNVRSALVRPWCVCVRRESPSPSPHAPAGTRQGPAPCRASWM